MKNLPLITLVSLTVPFALAQEEKEAAKVDPNIRPAGEVVLKFEHKVEVPEIKRLDEEGVLEIFPGDVIHLEFREVEGELVDPKVVAKVTSPDKTITFKMTQDESMTMLSRATKIQQTVAFDCVHRGLQRKEFSPTNLRPTEKGLGGFDSWPNTVWILRLSNIEVTSKSASEVYNEKVGQRRGAQGGEEKTDPSKSKGASEAKSEGGEKPKSESEASSE